MLSFHKGFTDIIKIWKKINPPENGNKLGIIRDFDDQPNAQKKHDELDDGVSICVRTSSSYTLEPEIVDCGDNYEILKKEYGEQFGWSQMTQEQLQNHWREAKATTMLTICRDIAAGKLPSFSMPKYIQEVFDFLNN